MDFGQSNAEIGQKMANGQLLFLALPLENNVLQYTWLKVFAEAEHNPVPSEVQKSRGTSSETGAIAAPDSVVNTTKAALIRIT